MSETAYEFHRPNKETLADYAITPSDSELPTQPDCNHDAAWCFCNFDDHIFIAPTVR
jgi:hypothetical protein